METLNTKKSLPTALPPQDITAVGYTPDDLDDLLEYGEGYNAVSIVLEDARGGTTALDDVELEVFGYINDGHTPMLLHSSSVDSERGTISVPLDDIPSVQYLYARQASDVAPIGPTAGAAVVSTVAAPFNLAAADTLIMSVDQGALETATFDAAAAAVTCSNSETYAISDGDTLTFEVDGVPFVRTFETGGAAVTNTAAEPYSLTAGQTLTVDIDGGGAATATWDAAAATITCANSETYAISDGDTLTVKIDGGDVQTATFNAAAATVTSGNTQPFSLSGTETLLIDVDGGGAQTVTFLLGDFATPSAATAAEAVIRINTDTTGLTATAVGGAVVLTSDTVGTGSSVQVTGGTANAGILGFDTDLHSGSGDFVDASVATAAEIIAVLDTDLTGCTNSGTTDVVITSNTLGTDSGVQVTGGTANTALGFDTGAVAGTGDVGDISAVTAAEIVTVLNADVSGQTASASGGYVTITSDTTGTSASVEVTGGTANGTLLFSVDIVQGTGDFVDASAATAEEIVTAIGTVAGATISGTTDVTITSTTLGTDSTVEVTGGTANTALGFSTSPVQGTGDVGDITAVTAAEVKTVVEADVGAVTVTADASGYITITSNATTGASSHIQVSDTSTAEVKMGFDTTEHVGPTEKNSACNYIMCYSTLQPREH